VPFTDPLGRDIGYLRLSLTKACQMKCAYCRPAWLTNPDARGGLTAMEIGHLVDHLARNHGLRKVRLTGGDPTARPDLIEVIREVADVPQIHDLAMTTNGLTLARRAGDYAAAGLMRVNVSLDSLDRKTFADMTGVDGLARVLDGIDAALEAGLGPVKLNTVVMRGSNQTHLAGLVGFAARKRVEIRFIEMMPMGPLAGQWAQRYVPEAEMRATLERTHTGWDAIAQGHDAARRFRVVTPEGLDAVVGFITPMSCNFCADCNRIRIAADGTLYPCLMDKPAGSIRPALRPWFNAHHLDQIITQSLTVKQPEHPVQGFVTMTHIGG